MKKFAIIAAMLLAAACTPRPALRSADLIFVGIPSDYSLEEDAMSEAIGSATNRDSLNIIHVAIADVDESGQWIIDATLKRGVDRHPLDSFITDFTLKDGSLPQFIVMRLKDDKDAARYVRNALQYTGLKYNNSFVPCDTAKYCSELVRDSYVSPDGAHIFSEAPMNFLGPDGKMPVYWEQLFAILGVPVPQGEPGTNPKAMMGEAVLEQVNVDITAR